MVDLLIRFFVGGIVVSAFAVLGDLIRPRTYAGLYGAAPSVALATLVLTIGEKGRMYAAIEARTMILGAAAFLIYAGLASVLLRRRKRSALFTAIALLPVWFGVSFGLYAAVAGKARLMIQARTGALKETRPKDYLLRFAFGGLACVLAGVVAKKFGPAVGGLFLSFPAIFPATATLIETHQKRKEGKREGAPAGRRAAGIEAAGTAIGCVGLAAFGLTSWKLLPELSPWIAIPAALAGWSVVGNLLWRLVNRWLD